MNAARETLRRSLERVFRQKEHQHIVDWADTGFWLPPSSSNNKDMIRWKTYGYQRFILHSMADLDTYKTVVKKPTQVGITKCILIGIGYESAHRNRANGVWLPSRGDANKFSNVEISAMLEHVPEVREQLIVDFDKKDKDNTTRRRAFKGAQSHCQGTQTLQDVSSVPVEHAFGDEVSKYPQVLRGGKEEKGKAPVDGIEGRLDSATDPCLSLVSTCTEEGVCQITGEFNGCRERFERGFYCPSCGCWQVFEWGSQKTYHGFKWDRKFFDNGEQDDLESALTVRYHCGNEDAGCEHEFVYEDLEDLDENHGEYRSERLRFDEKLYKYFDLESGEEVTSPYSNGIQVRGWFNRRKAWWRGVLAFIEAAREAKEGNPGKMVDWTQDYEANAYKSPEASEYVQHGYLMSRQEEAPLELDGYCNDIQMVTKFWDVQGDRIECLTTGWGAGHECWLMEHDVYWGNPAKGRVLEKVQEHTEKTYEKQNGTVMPVFLSGVDSGYLPAIVNSYCTDDYKFKIIPTVGSTSLNKPIVQARTSASRGYGTFQTTLCPDTAKTQIYKMYKVETPGHGYIHIPDKECFDEKFIKQLVAETRKPKGGVFRWECPDHVRNEALDLLCGNLAISIIAQQRFAFSFVNKSEFRDDMAATFESDASIEDLINAANE